jgi:hypothetical protein
LKLEAIQNKKYSFKQKPRSEFKRKEFIDTPALKTLKAQIIKQNNL